MDRDTVRQRIEREYERRGDTTGWRLLYSPWRTIENASVAFIGLNPGTSRRNAEHSDLSCEGGSAYELERWGENHEPGASPLQRQVRAVCAKLGANCEDVLTGNLVPFRSRNLRHLEDLRGAMRFGMALWRDILKESKVTRIVAMGRHAQEAVFEICDVSGLVETRPAGWGRQRIRLARNDRFTVIGMPHLSRFRIMDRPQSQLAVDWAFRS